MITTHNNPIFNPKRGIQKYSESRGSNFNPLTQVFLNEVKNGDTKSSVVYRYYYLDTFMTSNISTAYLNLISADLQLLAQNNMTVLLRFAYKRDFTEASTTNIAQQPTKSRILSQIAQLAPVLNANKQAIMSVQMGFIGTWGEWYYTNSSEFGHAGSVTAAQWNNRRDVVNACLTQLDSDINLQVRYVQAYNNVANSNPRIGFYNDAFLNDYGDQGTFGGVSQNQNPVGTANYNFLRSVTQSAFMTGETNGVNAPRTNIDNALIELDLCNWDTLNDAYHPTVITNWKATSDWIIIVNKLGYRFQVESAVCAITQGNILNYNFQINNVGFAPLKFDANFVIKAVKDNVETNILTFPLKGIKGQVNLQGNITLTNLEGTYSLEFDSELEFANTSKSLFIDLNITQSINPDPEPEVPGPDPEVPDPEAFVFFLPITKNTLLDDGFTDFVVYDLEGNFIGNDPTLSSSPRGIYKINCVKNNKNFIFTVKK
jgi:hypothetical protein